MSVLRPFSVAFAAILLLGTTTPELPDGSPSYDGSGRMLFPANYREWVFLSSGLNMSYNADAAKTGHDVFGNTFVQPSAYKAFLKFGVWPDKTVIVLENRGGASHGSINKHGFFQTTDYMGAEAHVKDEARFQGGWGFFAFDKDGRTASQIPYKETCYSCHQQHAAVDTTFVQFYPTLLPVATRLGTLSKAYLADMPDLKR